LSDGIGGIMKMNKQNIIELLFGFLSGALTVGVIYGVKMEITPIWIFSSVVLIYTVWGDRFS
jgi:hypothetical protein